MTKTITPISDGHLEQVNGGTILPYLVQAGDSIGVIAQKYHVTVEQLMKWNNLKDNEILKVGQQLKIKY